MGDRNTENDRFHSRRDDDDLKPKSRPVSRKGTRRHSSRSEKPLDFGEMLAAAALQRKKVAPLYTTRDGQPTVRIRALQHMIIIHLRRVIAGYVAEIVGSGTATPEMMERVRKTMKHYVQALRDLKYMLEAPSQNKRISTFMKDLLYLTDTYDGAIMADAGLLPRDLHGNNNYRLFVPDYTGQGGSSYRKETAAEQTQQFLGRVWMALFGGSVLIAPMLIMRLHPTIITELATTSAFVLAFGVILAWYMTDADKKDILAATAAYAAVLVVFIGAAS